MSKKRVLITGFTGQVGRHLAMFLTRLGAADEFYLASRDPRTAGTVLHNTQFCALMRGQNCSVSHVTMDLLDADRTAEQLEKLKPTVIAHCATLLSLFPFFPALRQRQNKMNFTPGFAHTLPKDTAVLWPLMSAVRQASPETLVVNLASPDNIAPVLHQVGLCPDIGAGTIDSTAQGVRFAVARDAGVDLSQVEVWMIGHHAIRRFPAKEVPFVMKIWIDGQEVTDQFGPHQLIDEASDITGVETVDSPVSSNAPITAASGVESCRAILTDSNEIRHGSGLQGVPGAMPVKLSAKGAEEALSIMNGFTVEKVREINTVGMKMEGIEEIKEDGTVVLSDGERYWLKEGLGLDWKEIELGQSYEMSKQLAAAYNQMKREEEGR